MQYRLPIVGAKFRPPAAGILRVLPQSCALLVAREPGNEYDVNAIKVLVTRSALAQLAPEVLEEAVRGYGFSLDDILARESWHLGYIPRGDAATLAPLFDAEGAQRIARPAQFVFSLEGQPQCRFSLDATGNMEDVA